MAYILLPFMFLPIYASVEKLDRSLLEASFGSWRQSAPDLQTSNPAADPARHRGGFAVLVFIPSLGNFIVPDILGGAKVLMIGNLVEQQFLSARNWPFGAALSVMIMLVMFLLDHCSTSGRSAGRRRRREAISHETPVRESYGILFLVFVYAPIVMVVVLSFNSNPINMMIWSGFTFDWYWSIFGYPTQLNEQTLYVESTDQLLAAVKNSLIVAAARRRSRPFSAP